MTAKMFFPQYARGRDGVELKKGERLYGTNQELQATNRVLNKAYLRTDWENMK